MTESDHTEKLEIWVRRHWLSQTVSAGKRIEGVLEIFGIVMDRGRHAAANSMFDCKEARITLVSKGLPADLAKHPGEQKTFGSLTLLEGVQRIHRDFGEPIRATAEVDNEAFTAIVSQLASAEVRQIASSLTLRFLGALPAPADSYQEHRGVPLELLDTGETQTYALLSIGVGTGQRDWHFGRVPQSPALLEKHLPSYSAAMSLIEASASIDLDSRMIRGIEATFVLHDHKSPFNGSRVEVSWEEYARDEGSEDYPDLADAGTFDARAPKGVPTSSDCGLYLYLRYTQHDARNLLLPFLLNRPQGLCIVMRATLLADESALWAQPDGMTGRVTKLTLHLSRPET